MYSTRSVACTVQLSAVVLIVRNAIFRLICSLKVKLNAAAKEVHPDWIRFRTVCALRAVNAKRLSILLLLQPSFEVYALFCILRR